MRMLARSFGIALVALVGWNASGCGSSDGGAPPAATDTGVHDTPAANVVLTLTMPACGGGGEVARDGTASTYATSARIDVPAGATLGLTAKADTYSTFAGWTGDCTGTSATCTLTMDGPKTIAPTFHPATGGGAYRVFSSRGNDLVKSIVIDADGGSIVTGLAASALDLGAGSVGSDGGFTFLARYDASAKLTWAKTLPMGVAAARLSSTGDVVIAGTFVGAPDLGGGPLAPPAGAVGAFFVARFSHGDGAHLSSKAFGMSNATSVGNIAIDPADDAIVLTGTYDKGTDLGGGVLTPDTGIFIARVSKDGALGWTRTIAVKPFYYAESLAIDGAGNVLVGGHFEQGTIDLGGGPFSAAGSTSSSSFLAKYAKADGAHLWSKAYGTGSHNHLRALAVGPGDALALFADLSGTASFGGPTLTAKGNDFAVVRLASDGGFGWQAQFSGPYEEEPRAIAFDTAGDLVLASTYEKDFTLGTQKLPANGLTDVLVARVKGTDGTPTWVRRVGCAGEDDVYGMAIDGDAVRVVGTFADSIDLGDGPQKAQGTGDGFLVTLKP